MKEVVLSHLNFSDNVASHEGSAIYTLQTESIDLSDITVTDQSKASPGRERRGRAVRGGKTR